MEYSEVLKRNKDLDLRRFGRNEYSKALKAGQESESGQGGQAEDETQTERSLYTFFPFFTKIVGVVEITNYEGVYGSWTEKGFTITQMDNPIVPLDELESYLKAVADEGQKNSVMLLAVTEYDENYYDPAYQALGVVTMDTSQYNGQYYLYYVKAEAGSPYYYEDQQGNKYLVYMPDIGD